jgi:hypothetical protein
VPGLPASRVTKAQPAGRHTSPCRHTSQLSKRAQAGRHTSLCRPAHEPVPAVEPVPATAGRHMSPDSKRAQAGRHTSPCQPAHEPSTRARAGRTSCPGPCRHTSPLSTRACAGRLTSLCRPPHEPAPAVTRDRAGHCQLAHEPSQQKSPGRPALEPVPVGLGSFAGTRARAGLHMSPRRPAHEPVPATDSKRAQAGRGPQQRRSGFRRRGGPGPRQQCAAVGPPRVPAVCRSGYQHPGRMGSAEGGRAGPGRAYAAEREEAAGRAHALRAGRGGTASRRGRWWDERDQART